MEVAFCTLSVALWCAGVKRVEGDYPGDTWLAADTMLPAAAEWVVVGRNAGCERAPEARSVGPLVAHGHGAQTHLQPVAR
jgi:hypothetical protein